MPKKYKYVEFKGCKNENQVIKKLEDGLQNERALTMVSTGNVVKLQTKTDPNGKDTDNPYINMIGSIERINGELSLKYYFNNKVKYILIVLGILYFVFLGISLTSGSDIKHTLIISGVTFAAGLVFGLNNYLNISFNKTTIEDFLKKFGEIKEL